MNVPHHRRDPSQSADEAARQRSLQYLLGELRGDEAVEFEQQLNLSPQLAAKLSQVAELVVAIAELPPAAIAVPLDTATAAQESCVQPQRCTQPQRARWPVLASILAVAACLALLVFNLPTAAPPIPSVTMDTVASLPAVTSEVETSELLDHSEDLLIAQAWASSLVSDLETDSTLNLLELEDPIVAAISDDPAEIDSVLSWMFVAVSADIASQPTGVANGS